MTERNSRLVYSTECPVLKKETPAARKLKMTPAPSKNRAIVCLDRKRRGGKSVTVVTGLQLSAEDSEKLLKELKTKLGAGGTVKNGTLEIQGDHRDAVIAALSRIGVSPKRLGR